MTHLLIVGAGPGIGTSLAIHACRQGARVTVAARSTDTRDAVAAAVTAAVPDANAEAIGVDAGDPAVLREVIAAHARTEAFDAAVFNVSAWVPGGWDADLADVETGLRSGVVSGWAMAQALIPSMRQMSQATLIFTGGGTADHPMRASIALGLQKAALRNLAMGLDADLLDTPIRSRTLTICGTIAPDTPFAPDRIAAALWDLIDDRDGPCVVDFTGE